MHIDWKTILPAISGLFVSLFFEHTLYCTCVKWKKGSPRLDPTEFQTRGLLAVSDPLFRFYCQGYFTPWVIIIRKDFTIFQRQNKKARVVSKKVCISFPEFWVLKKRKEEVLLEKVFLKWMTQEFLPKSEQKMAYTDPKFTFKLQVVREIIFLF